MNSILNACCPIPLTTTSVHVPQLLGSTRAGFPSPAEDLQERRIDLSEHLITHPQATFIIQVRGLSMVEAGIFDGDLLVVNRALKPKHNCIVVAVIEGEYTV
ncbi:LexA family protein, partial [Curvibacter delicatus]|uniref:LexA family protein n=1 Tax=Curvibacter delicatus TaxID=80879 RepID=UPI000A0770D2